MMSLGSPGWCPHGLPDVHELSNGVLVVGAVLRVVLQDEVLERLPEVDLLGLLQAQRDHRDLGAPGEKRVC